MDISKILSTADKDVIEKNEKWFKFHLWAPVVVPAILAVLLFLAGFICAIAIDAIFIVYFWIIGGLFCLIWFAIMRVNASYKILHVYYLKQLLANKGVSSVTDGAKGVDEFDDLPMI